MPWSVVQQNSGTFVGTAGGAATLGSGTTAGTTLLIIFGRTVGAGSTLTVTGFTRDTPAAGGAAQPSVYRKTAVAAETSWAFSQTAAVPMTWDVYEVDGLDTAAPVDTTPGNVGSGTGTTVDTSTVGVNNPSSVYDGMVIAVHVAFNSAAAVIPTWSGHGQGLVEDSDHGVVLAATAIGTSISMLAATGPATWDVTATSSVSTTGGLGATHIVYAAAGARRAPNFDVICGFEVGTAAGLATTATQNPFDLASGSPAIVTGGRSGTYCLELSAAAAVENVEWSASGALGLAGTAGPVGVLRLAVLFPSSLPAGNLPFVAMGNTSDAVVRYVSASQQIGVKLGSGTEVLSANTVVADTWYGLDLRLTASASAATCDWQVDGVNQTQATGAMSAAAVAPIFFGWTAAQTGTVRIDDVAYSKVAGQYPAGDIRIYPLLADPAGTVTASTTADFQTFASNGTLTAWNATTALAAIDEWPPTIGASADGIVQSVTAASDFVAVPMQTRDAAANGEAIRAVRWYFPGWAATTTAATIGFRGFDGTTETVLFAAADPNFDNSTTTPGWVCRMHRTLASALYRTWTQAQLDALTARIGFSSDASPVIGVHAVMAEVAMRADPVAQPMFGDPSDPAAVQVSVSQDQDSAGIVQITTTATSNQGAAVHYEVNAVGSDVTAPPGTSRTDPVGADDAPSANYIAMYPDPEGVADT